MLGLVLLKRILIWYIIATAIAIVLSTPPLLLLPVGPEKAPIMAAVNVTSMLLSYWICFRGGAERLRRRLPTRARPE